jgi:F420H(2)-dependent quinone reductase
MKVSDLYNPIVKTILKSPLHGVMSENTMLLTFFGHKSGKEFTTPINYIQEGKRITVITGFQHHWWMNLRKSSPVTLLVRGEEYEGLAQVSTDSAIEETVEKVYKGISHAKAAEISKDMVVITIDLN